MGGDAVRKIRVIRVIRGFGGLFPHDGTGGSAPAELIAQFAGQPSMVAYGWETTGPQAEQWFHSGQFFRLVADRPQVGAGAFAWIKAAEPVLGPCITTVSQTGPNQLSLNRKSTIGFTALELHLLADWLESPTFPRGLYTFAVPAPQN